MLLIQQFPGCSLAWLTHRYALYQKEVRKRVSFKPLIDWSAIIVLMKRSPLVWNLLCCQIKSLLFCRAEGTFSFPLPNNWIIFPPCDIWPSFTFHCFAYAANTSANKLVFLKNTGPSLSEIICHSDTIIHLWLQYWKRVYFCTTPHRNMCHCSFIEMTGVYMNLFVCVFPNICPPRSPLKHPDRAVKWKCHAQGYRRKINPWCSRSLDVGGTMGYCSRLNRLILNQATQYEQSDRKSLLLC